MSIYPAYREPHPLQSCHAKVRRAQMHLRELNDSVQAFVDSNPYGVIASEPDPDTAEVIFRAKVFRHPSHFESTHWGILIGEVVHDLRSALDHAVWILTERASGPAPPWPIPWSSPWRRIGFPIVTDSANWTKKETVERIIGLRPGLPALIEATQPFATGPKTPDREPLAVLNELWKLDKHQTLAVTKVYGIIREMSHVPPVVSHEIGNATVNLWLVPMEAVGPFEDGTELGRLTQSGGALINPKAMQMQPQFAFDVAFPDGAPAYGEPVTKTLELLIETVETILLELGVPEPRVFSGSWPPTIPPEPFGS